MKTAILTALCFVAAVNVSAQQLQFTGSYPTQASRFVHVQGNMLAVIDSSNLLLIDVYNPYSPVLLGSVAIPGRPERVDIAGSFAYVAAGDSGVKVVDISNPANPAIIGSFPTTTYVTDVIVEDTVCYVSRAHGFSILNVADPSEPSVIDSMYLGSFWNSAMDKKLNDIYYFADWGEFTFIEAMNVADPRNPRVVDDAGTGYCIRDISASGNTLLATSSCFGAMYAYDISVPDSILGYHYYSLGNVNSVCTGLGYAFVTVPDGGVRIIDYSNLDSMRTVGTYDTPGQSSSIRIYGHWLYVADSSSLQILSFSNPGNCHYVVGDINGSGTLNGLDVVFAVGYFQGGQFPAYLCECTAGNWWYVAGDVNGSCSFNGLDVSYMVTYLKGGPGPHPCPDCPPAP